MATLLPNSKPLSSHFIPDSRSLLLHSSRFTLRNGEKLFWASSISSRRWKESCITFTSQRRRTAFISDTFVPDDNKEDWDNEEEEEEEGEEEGRESIPLREMTQWLQNKPSGFGEGKRYDTTVEDKLLEEIEKTRKDQLEEKKKPRVISKENAGSVQKQEKQNVSEVIKSDTEVRVWNLPKKKNIDRDLWKVFKGFPGIITISPAVTGNRKTRDPICRGFAFVGFESDDAAYRFVHKYSNQNLLFGKVQKKISCDVVNVHGVLNSPDSSRGSSTSSNTSERRDSGSEISMSYALDISESTNGIPLVEPNEEFLMLPNNRNISLSNNKTAVMAFEHSSSSYPGFVEGENEVNEDPQSITPMSSCQNREKSVKKDKTKPAKSSKPHVLGSLARLKIKDRAVLTGVFSKYGEGVSPASNET